MELARLNLDTYKTVNLLKERGYTEKQAEGFIEVMQDAALSGVATRNDLHAAEVKLQAEIQKSRNENLRFQLIQTIAIITVMISLFALFS